MIKSVCSCKENIRRSKKRTGGCGKCWKIFGRHTKRETCEERLVECGQREEVCGMCVEV